MKIGIRFSGKGPPGYNDIFYFLHTLQAGKIKEISTEYLGCEIQYGDNTYLFSAKELEDDCDIKVFAAHDTQYIHSCIESDTEYQRIKNTYDTIVLFSPGEALVTRISDEMLQKFLDEGNFYVTGTTNISFEHKNLFIDKFMGPKFLYHQLGFNYINFHQNTKTKRNLVGVYHRKQYINDVIHSLPCKKSIIRNEVVNKLKELLDTDLTIYENNHILHPEILEPYNFLGLWITNHISGYSDYATSVCNLIFESFTPHEDSPRASLSEKTIKAIIFGKENIFFMWHGPDDLFIYLKNLGFWFLNMEFYDFKTPKRDEMTVSVIRTIEYLKHLQTQFKTNDELFQYLYDRHGEKLLTNYYKFKEQLIDTSIGNNILTSLHNFSRGNNEV